MVVNVHSTCLKEIEELKFSAKSDKNKASTSQDAASAAVAKVQKMEVEAKPLAG